jgi:hypothetical protein
MEQIPIIGPNGKPILYAYLDGGDLKFQFEYYGRNEDEGDYEFIHTVAPADFSAIAIKFGLDPKNEILANVQKITDLGHGPKLKKALTNKEIKNELFTWIS